MLSTLNTEHSFKLYERMITFHLLPYNVRMLYSRKHYDNVTYFKHCVIIDEESYFLMDEITPTRNLCNPSHTKMSIVNLKLTSCVYLSFPRHQAQLRSLLFFFDFQFQLLQMHTRGNARSATEVGLLVLQSTYVFYSLLASVHYRLQELRQSTETALQYGVHFSRQLKALKQCF